MKKSKKNKGLIEKESTPNTTQKKKPWWVKKLNLISIEVSLSKEVIDMLNKLAEQRHMTRNALLRNIVIFEWLEENAQELIANSNIYGDNYI